MPHLIHPDQVEYTLGRQVFNATRKILNVLHYTKSNHIPTLVVNIDDEKAFDRIHLEYLKHTFSIFVFQGNILSAILALYSKPPGVLLDSVFSD